MKPKPKIVAKEIPYASLLNNNDEQKYHDTKHRYVKLMKLMKKTNNLELMNIYMEELNVLEPQIWFKTDATISTDNLEPANASTPVNDEYRCSFCHWFD